MRISFVAVGVVVGAMGLMGCTGTTSKGAETPVTQLPGITITPNDPDALVEKMNAANDKLLHDDEAGAAEAYDAIYKADPNGATAAQALFGAGAAYYDLDERDKAAERFRDCIAKFPDADTTKIATIRLGRLLAYDEHWAELETVADQILARKDLRVIDQIDGLGAKGLALVSLDRTDEAEKVVEQARDLIDKNQLGETGVWPIELAQVSFALGEIRRVRGEKIVFDPLPENFGAVLEARCTLLLSAQDAYSDAIRAKDAHWSAMAGFRLGQLYARLHADVMKAPFPAAKTEKQQQLFEGAMRLRYRVLLKKGLTMMTRVVELAERTGENSEWVHRARDAKKELETALDDENAAIAKLPYDEKQLQAELDKIVGRTAASPTVPKPK